MSAALSVTAPLPVPMSVTIKVQKTGAGFTVKVVLPATLPLVAKIVVPPAFTAEAKPAALMVAVVVLEEAQVTLEVRFCVELSLYVPVAVNCSVPPAVTDGFAGVTAIDTSVLAALEMENWALACWEPVDTVIVRDPVAAVELITRLAVAVVVLVTVKAPLLPAPAPPTEIPGPKFASVNPFAKVVYWPVIDTVKDCPAWALEGFKVIAAGGLMVREELFTETNAAPVVVVPAMETLYAVGEVTLIEPGITK
jgi:hypothetical protein